MEVGCVAGPRFDAPERAVGEVGIPQPVVFEQVVLAGADVVADRPTDRRINRRPLGRAEALQAKEFPDGAGGDGGEKLPFGSAHRSSIALAT